MGMYDIIYAELDCPFCGRQYRNAPLTQEQAEKEIWEYKQHQIQSRQDFLHGEKKSYLQDFWYLI
jgi:MoaA/NifB/PqqE/SkfB family radical SAM enzyme